MPGGTPQQPFPIDATLRLTTLGGAQLGYPAPDGQSVTVLGPGKPLALLIYLAFSPGRTASREHLIDLLWSDLEPERGKHALRQTIYFLRHNLGERSLASRAGELQLTLPVVTDRDAFLEAMDGGDLDATVALYTGSFLPGFASPGGAEFEHWADLERERLRAVFLRAAETLARRRLAMSSFREAQRLARRVRDEDPLDESGWRLLIETLVSAHDHLAAAIEADALSTLLQAESREPEPATRASLRLARQRPQGDAPPDADAEGRGRGLIAELVGREREFSAIIRAWEEARRGLARHVHIDGAAGLGKTRLLTDVFGRLRASGANVVSLRASPGDRRIAYALAGELARAVGTLSGAAAISPAAASSLIALHPGLSSQFAGAMDQSIDDEALRRRTMAVSEVLAAVADESPLALLVDDLHWADPSSQQLLAGVLDRLHGAHVLLVTAARPTRGGLAETATTERLALAPLSVGQVGELLASLGALPREDWARSLTVALHGTSGGVPLLVLETLQLALERGSLVLAAEGWSSADPVFLVTELQAGGALRHRLGELSPPDRRLLLFLAAAGAPLSVPRLARAAERPAEELEAELITLERRGFVARTGADWEPAHDQIAELALDLATLEERKAAHLALGRVLTEDSAEEPLLLQRAGHHLAAAGRDDELVPVYARWVTLSEQRGDRRPPAALASELLGEHASAPRVERLVGSLPLWRRAAAVTPSRRGAWAATVLLAVGSLVAGAIYLPRGALPEARLLAIAPAEGDTAVVASLPVDHDMLGGSGPIDVSRARTLTRLPRWSRLTSAIAASPDGRQLAYALSTQDSGVIDVFEHDAAGTVRRLTAAPRDDDEPDWSPDGRWLVMATSRWAPKGADDADLGILDPATRQVRQLTAGRPYDYAPHWSPDGARIGFARRHFTLFPNQLCWITVDAHPEHCFSPAGYEVVSVLGWTDRQHLLAVVDSVDHQLLMVVDVDRQTTRIVETGPVSRAALSGDGQWVACFCQRGGEATPAAWFVFPVNEPERARRITRAGVPFVLAWGGPAQRAPFLDRLKIVTPKDPISSDAAYRLRVEGYDPSGEVLAPPAATLLWRSADTSVAVIDSATGTVHPRHPGTVTVTVSAGGWRADTAVIAIGAPASRTRLLENWLRPGAPDWVFFGEPRPTLVVGPGHQPALALDGDETFTSGVYSRETFDARRGLGLEVRVSTPITRPQWQALRVAFTAALDDAALAVADLKTGSGFLRPAPLPDEKICGVAYPGGESANARERFALTSGGVTRRLPADQATVLGGWYAMRIQIFPDGTCGFAVGGRPLLHSEAVVSTTEPFRVLLHGTSVATSILAGPVEVWEGVRGDVDWTVLEK